MKKAPYLPALERFGLGHHSACDAVLTENLEGHAARLHLHHRHCDRFPGPPVEGHLKFYWVCKEKWEIFKLGYEGLHVNSGVL